MANVEAAAVSAEATPAEQTSVSTGSLLQVVHGRRTVKAYLVMEPDAKSLVLLRGFGTLFVAVGSFLLQPCLGIWVSWLTGSDAISQTAKATMIASGLGAAFCFIVAGVLLLIQRSTWDEIKKQTTTLTQA